MYAYGSVRQLFLCFIKTVLHDIMFRAGSNNMTIQVLFRSLDTITYYTPRKEFMSLVSNPKQPSCKKSVRPSERLW